LHRYIEACTLAGAAGLDVAYVVLHEDRVVIQPVQPARSQKMGKPVGAGFKLGIGHDFA
jgi:hypothetical protein